MEQVIISAGPRGGRALCRRLLPVLLILAGACPVYADSPWENAVNVLQAAFTSTIARGLSLVAIVVGGLMFAFGEGDSKRMLAGILFGVGMAIGAVNFMSWLFPG
jgi:type IV secretory pathway VirB2 component (pilin)